MKIRRGFVSNSSTTSFTCDVCREHFAGMDLCARDVDHLMCINGHIFCQDKRLNNDITVKYEDGDDEDEYGEDDSIHCPVCQMKTISLNDVHRYIFKKNGQTTKQVQEEIKTKFSNYNEFLQYIK